MYSPLLILTCCVVTCLIWPHFTASSDSLNVTLVQAPVCPADAQEPWSYRGDNGPAFWGESYPQCNGARQSPILVDGSNVVEDENLENLKFYLYEIPITNLTIRNNGRTLQVVPDYPFARHIIVNGTYYGLYDIHFHWGSTKRKGSEHIVNGVQYAMEMHLVHKSYSGDLAVVAVFFEQDSGINAELQHIVNEIPKVMFKDSEIVSRFRLNLYNLLPEYPASFFLYEGSLTTPDCSETATWLLLFEPLLVGNTQIREFRKLYSATRQEAVAGCKISGNIRPIQHPHGRRVRSSNG